MGNSFNKQSQALPSGTVTILFTDIEGSTKLAQQYPEDIPLLLARHHSILHDSIQANGGYVFQIVGDAFCTAFHTAPDALNAALMAQRSLQHEDWVPAPVMVRMGIHTGVAQAREMNDGSVQYHGYLALARVQDIMSSAHGGQVLLSGTGADLVQDNLPPGVLLRDMGEHQLKVGLNREHLWQLVAEDLQFEFPPLKISSLLPNNLPVQLNPMIGRLLGRWRRAVVALLGIAAYTLLVGGEASVVRAAIMGG